MLVLAEVAARTGDRKLLQDLVSEALGLHPSTSPLLSCGAAYVVALAAWHRGDVHDAVRWLGGQNTRFITPLWPNVFDQLILMSRVASAAGDAGLNTRADFFRKSIYAGGTLAASGVLMGGMPAMGSCGSCTESSVTVCRAKTAATRHTMPRWRWILACNRRCWE